MTSEETSHFTNQNNINWDVERIETTSVFLLNRRYLHYYVNVEPFFSKLIAAYFYLDFGVKLTPNFPEKE